MFKKLFNKKYTRRYILVGLIVVAMIFLITQSDFRELIRDTSRQIWVFVVMLVLKLGEETLWRPMVVDEILEYQEQEEIMEELSDE